VPQEFAQLVSLRELYLSNNMLEGILPLPENLALEVLEIENNLGLRLNTTVTAETITNEVEVSNPNQAQLGLVYAAIGLASLVLIAVTALILRRRHIKKGDDFEMKPISTKTLKFVIKLDSGAFGEVWKATFNGESVAVKRILKSKISESNTHALVKMMNDEAEIMLKLRNDRIGIHIFTLII
jgi:hypothetical protein